MKNLRYTPLITALATAFAHNAIAHDSGSADSPVKSLGTVIVQGNRPTSLPTQIPTTIEGITREQIEHTINATDSEDALKYLPSLLVRKRYIGDYNHAVLSTRASGTGNSARSAVYADGILLSNYLGNGATFAPRWGMVTPGGDRARRCAVRPVLGRLRRQLGGRRGGLRHAHAHPVRGACQAQHCRTQPFELYSTSDHYSGKQVSASVGNRNGDWSWFINVNRTTATASR